MSDSFDAEHHLLRALAGMCYQYLDDGHGVDHMCMSAGEDAVELLVQYGLITPRGRGGDWTAAGMALINSS